MDRLPNDHALSIDLGEDVADVMVVRGQGACHAASPLSIVVVGLSEPRLLRNSVSARAQYCKPA